MREKIIERSVGLFNRFGINQTSFRDIASSLNISDGHVRYYFKTKEGLLLAIFDKMDKEILAHVPSGRHYSDHGQAFADILNEVFTIMVRYRFIFMESPGTFNQYPNLTLAYKNLVVDRKTLFMNTFKALKESGFFKDEFNEELQKMAFYNIFIISDSWIRYYTILNNKEPDKEAVEFHSKLAFSILVPYVKRK